MPGDTFRADARPTVADDRVHADVLLRDGRVAFQSGRAAEALALFVRAADANPHAASCAGVACQALGRLDEAEAWHRRAAERAPGDPFVLSNLGTCLAGRGRLADALAIFQRARAADPADCEILPGLGRQLDVEALRLPGADLAALRKAVPKRLPRHMPRERFLAGPVPWQWLQRAAVLPGKALAVGLLLWLEAGCVKNRTVRFSKARAARPLLSPHGLSPLRGPLVGPIAS